jgi:hypothetical protein
MRERKTVFFLTLGALVFRLLHVWIFSNELVVGGDQMQNIMLSRQFARGEIYGFLHPYWTPLYPFLLGVVAYFTDSLILPSLIVSILAGSLAVPLTYYLVMQFYGRREALVASAIAIFYPHLLNSVFTLGTENIYLLLVGCALIAGWKALRNDSAFDYWLTGILVGLAYLTRPEGIGYTAFFALVIAGGRLWRKNFTARGALSRIGIFLLGFAVLAVPYLLYLRAETGDWTVSGKTDLNFAAGIYFEGGEAELGWHGSFLYVVVDNIIEFHRCFPNLFPIFLLILAALGLFRSRWRKERWAREAYLLLFCLVTVAVYVASVVQIRYFYVMLPVLFGWTARGLIEAREWLSESLHEWLPDKFYSPVSFRSFASVSLILIYLYVLPLNFFMLSREKAWQNNGYEERDAGLWLKKNSGKPSPLVFSPSLRPVFYAESRHMPPTTENVEEILSRIRRARVDYVIISERSLKRNVFLKGFTEKLSEMPDFELIYEKNDHPGYGISIFRLK